MKKNRVVLFWRVMLVIVMAVIFIFSAQTGTVSGAVSKKIAGWMSIKPVSGIPDIDMVPLILGFSIRKYGHILIFLLLGLCAFFSVERERGAVAQSVFGIGFSYVYACLDELHQLFVEGRAGMFSDTLIDLGGIIVGVALARLIQSLIHRKKDI